MGNDMGVRTEIWPIVADQRGMWLASGVLPWLLRANIEAGDEDAIHADTELEIYRNGIDLSDVAALHSTSWRPGPGGWYAIFTYAVVIRQHDHVPARWRGAMPISRLLVDKVGRPLPQPATEPPIPRRVDVLMHALRHLRWLVDTDDTVGPPIDLQLGRHLDGFRPALAHMYRHAVSD
jgi:hypothetical protein